MSDGRLLVVREVAAGAGIGQYRLAVEPATIIDWKDRPCPPGH